jgi:uncharacterized protein (TIGR02145 family)
VRKIFAFALTALIVLAGCTKEYDDSALLERIKELEDRVSGLETLASKLTQAQESNVHITSYAELEDGSGWTITFSDGSTIEVTDGVDGTNGSDGKDGADGEDGADGADGVKGDKGDTGNTGAKGDQGDSLISSIEEAGNTIIITLTNGEVYKFSKGDPKYYDEGVMIGDVKWATRNVDMPGTFAATPESYGMYYQWGRNIGWDGSINANAYDANGEIRQTPDWDSSDFNEGDSSTPWPAENDPCPEGWRLPTKDEFVALRDAGTTEKNVNGVYGQEFGAGDNIIFLPAMGFRSYSDGDYWSATPSSTANGYFLYFFELMITPSYGNTRAYGFAVRCVAEQ